MVSALNGLTDQLVHIVENNIEENSSVRDTIISKGEQFSAELIEYILDHKGLESKSLNLSDDDFPIITEMEEHELKIDFEKTMSKAKEILPSLLSKGIIPIIPGFVGKTNDGDIQTFGRGGSDTTAIIMGSILSVDEIILLKDVPGIMRCDPKISQEDKVIEKIEAKKVMHIGNNGGEIVNPEALKYKNNSTDIRVVNFDNENFLKEGTKIVGTTRNYETFTVHESLAMISIVPNGSTNKIDKYFDRLGKNKIDCIENFKSKEYWSICLEQVELDNAIRVIHDEIKSSDDEIAISHEKDIALIEIKFGPNIDLNKHLFKIHKKLFENSIRIISTKFDNHDLILTIKNEDLEEFMNALEMIA